ncbi:MAG: hypothetical protein K2X11_14150 [Acetobacteraceae bacterium]|nr:hypothetical protein [Acetobacteraceae bacterium]
MRSLPFLLALPLAPLAGAAAKGPPTDAGGACAATLRAGCLRLQAACQLACPGPWSANPRDPAFTPTDRAGCTARCQQRGMACVAAIACR